MGYTLKIGEANVIWEEHGVEVEVETCKHDAAPAFGEPTDGTNARWPSYTAWADFCRALEITDIMFDARNGGSDECEVNGEYVIPLINNHPGHTPICSAHVQYIEAKVAAYKKIHPDHVAKYPPVKEGCEDKGWITPKESLEDDPRYDGMLCRAEWLVYWMRWALENCERPVFVNT